MKLECLSRAPHSCRYGYAEGAQNDSERMHDLIYDVLSTRAKRRRLNHALMLIDARRGMQEIDLELLKMIERALVLRSSVARDGGRRVTFSIVLTKADHLPQPELVHRIGATIDELWDIQNAHHSIFAVSASSGYGIQRLRTHISSFGAED